MTEILTNKLRLSAANLITSEFSGLLYFDLIRMSKHTLSMLFLVGKTLKAFSSTSDQNTKLAFSWRWNGQSCLSWICFVIECICCHQVIFNSIKNNIDNSANPTIFFLGNFMIKVVLHLRDSGRWVKPLSQPLMTMEIVMLLRIYIAQLNQ